MLEHSIQGMLGSEAPVTGKIYTKFFENGAFIHRFENLQQHSVSLYRSGSLKMEILTTHTGGLKGCSASVDAPRLDGARPLTTETRSDNVVRTIFIRHGDRPGNERVEQGLQEFHWPHTSTYFRCTDETMILGQREYRRVAR